MWKLIRKMNYKRICKKFYKLKNKKKFSEKDYDKLNKLYLAKITYELCEGE